MSAIKIIENLARKSLIKNQGSGIRSIPNRMEAEAEAGSIVAILQNAGLPLQQLDDYIRSEKDLLKYLNIIKNANKPRVIAADSPEGRGITEALLGKRGQVIKGKFGKPFAKEIESMEDIADKKVIEQMYRTAGPRSLDEDAGYLAEFIADDVGKVLDDLPIAEQNKFIERAKNALRKNVKKYQEKSVKELMDSGQVTKGARGMRKSKKVQDREMFEDANKRLTSDVDSIIKNIKSMEPVTAMKEASSVIGRKGKYKNLTPEESKKILLDTEDHIFQRYPIEDPEDFAYGGVAGLLGERQNFSMGKRAFLKLLGGAAAGIAGAKSGLIGIGGKSATKKAVTETVKSAGSTPPPYFFKLVDKIKTMGDDVTARTATQERQQVTRYKDYELTEDLTTGEQTIQKKSIEGDFDTPVPTSEEVYMNYKPGRGQVDEATGAKVADEYVEDTSYVGTSRGEKGEIIDTVDGVPDEVIQEGTMFEDTMTEFGKTKKADGGIARMLGE